MNTAKAIIGVKKTNKKTTEYFVGVDDGKLSFSANPIEGFTCSDKLAMMTLAEVLALSDKRNTYETYNISVN